MAITLRREITQGPSGPVERRVDERTTRVIISTPLAADGAGAYRAVVYREWVEYLGNQPVRITSLPPLEVPITSGLATIMRDIARAIDARSREATRDGVWPKDNLGAMMTPP